MNNVNKARGIYTALQLHQTHKGDKPSEKVKVGLHMVKQNKTDTDDRDIKVRVKYKNGKVQVKEGKDKTTIATRVNKIKHEITKKLQFKKTREANLSKGDLLGQTKTSKNLYKLITQQYGEDVANKLLQNQDFKRLEWSKAGVEAVLHKAYENYYSKIVEEQKAISQEIIVAKNTNNLKLLEGLSDRIGFLQDEILNKLPFQALSSGLKEEKYTENASKLLQESLDLSETLASTKAYILEEQKTKQAEVLIEIVSRYSTKIKSANTKEDLKQIEKEFLQELRNKKSNIPQENLSLLDGAVRIQFFLKEQEWTT